VLIPKDGTVVECHRLARLASGSDRHCAAACRAAAALVSKGLSNKEIARIIGRTEETVKAHLTNVFEKLGVADRTEAVMLAVQRGILHVD
jgi:DNA-binding CsgD family transcriptional regulator